jgi:hypothetical protein
MTNGRFIAFCYQESRNAMKRVSGNLNRRTQITQNHTTGIVWRVRITAPPKPREFDEYDVHRFEVGQVYEVPARLASLLVLGGYAEHVGGIRAEAADISGRFDKPTK